MSVSPSHYHNSTLTGLSARSALLRHLNTNTLALALFVALAFLTTSRAKEPVMGVSPHARDGEAGLTVRPCDMSVEPRQEVQVTKSPSQIVGNKGAPHR